ncbi:flavoprotein-like protein [Pelagophyceae sp. CCMP2097]|nr:flavoprotein-like protein [Pelagophyceae sp. CCMP2097]|mmetsp:Transcript_15229/g.53037  ORF Transcript_15229/g.53037 Transcript_15229/m.53037 type:complete len:175 (-) Transcript_15229:43-567(-)
MAPRLLLVWHSRTGLAEALADALQRGARDAAAQMGEPIHLDRLRARDAGAADVLRADGYLFCAPENLASVSGEMKEFFDRTFYDVLDDGGDSRVAGRPYGLALAAGSDGAGARAQVERILQGWRLRRASESVVVRNGLAQTRANILRPKTCPAEEEARCFDLGAAVAATLLLAT